MRKRFMQVLNYEPETGVLTWLVRTSNRVKIGSVEQCPSGSGYLKVRVDGQAEGRLAKWGRRVLIWTR